MLKYYGQYICVDTEAEILTLPGKAGDVAYAVDTDMRYKSNGTLWRPTDAVRILRGVGSIDGKTTGNTLMYTIPATSFRFVPIGVRVEYISITGTLGIAPTITVGTNATTYNNIATSSALATLLSSVGLTSTNALTISSNVTPLTNGQQVFAKVTAAATLYTAYTVRIDLLGYYEA